MKKILIILFSLLSINAFGQPYVDSNYGKYIYSPFFRTYPIQSIKDTCLNGWVYKIFKDTTVRTKERCETYYETSGSYTEFHVTDEDLKEASKHRRIYTTPYYDSLQKQVDALQIFWGRDRIDTTNWGFRTETFYKSDSVEYGIDWNPPKGWKPRRIITMYIDNKTGKTKKIK